MRFAVSTISGHLVASLCGACAIFAFSPYHYWWVLGIITGVLYLTLADLPVKTAAWRGFFFGLGFYGTGVSWVYISIHLFGNASSLLSTLLTALFVIILAAISFPPWCALYRFLTSSIKKHKVINVLAFSALWVLGEGFRSIIFTGFPWLLSGYSLIDTFVVFWAPVAGVYGLSLLMTMTSVSIFHWFKYPYQPSPSFLFAICLTLILAAWPLGRINWTTPRGIALTFTAVQGDIPQQTRWDQAYIGKIITTYLKLSEHHEKNNFIIWPENAVPTFYQSLPELTESLDKKLKQQGGTLLFGIPWLSGDNYYNSAVVLGEGRGQYFKQKLVPFGEYVPFSSWLRGLITFFDLPMSGFSKGSPGQHLVLIKKHPVAVYICYEAIYPDFAARLAHNSAFLVTMSNDSWFGKSAGPWQHFQMVRMRAVETGRYLVNVTNDSATSLIKPDGTIAKQIRPFRQGILQGRIQPMKGETPFMRYYSWPVFAICLLFVGIATRQKYAGKPVAE